MYGMFSSPKQYNIIRTCVSRTYYIVLLVAINMNFTSVLIVSDTFIV